LAALAAGILSGCGQSTKDSAGDCAEDYMHFIIDWERWDREIKTKDRDRFCERKKLIDKHNDNRIDEDDAWLIINNFTDWKDGDMAKLFGGPTHKEEDSFQSFASDALVDTFEPALSGPPPPSHVDWTLCMPPVKWQGKCKVSWVFASVALVDQFGGVHSEKQVLDCFDEDDDDDDDDDDSDMSAMEVALKSDDDDDDDKCKKGNHPLRALSYLMRKGSTFAPAYRYHPEKKNPSGGDDKCDSFQPVQWITKILKVQPGMEPMERALQSRVILTNFRALFPEFVFYSRGVFSTPCATNSKTYSHSVAIVGYHNHPHPKRSYWILRNSWAPGWGIDGYAYFEKGKNLCSIEEDIYTASVKSDDSECGPAVASSLTLEVI